MNSPVNYVDPWGMSASSFTATGNDGGYISNIVPAASSSTSTGNSGGFLSDFKSGVNLIGASLYNGIVQPINTVVNALGSDSMVAFSQSMPFPYELDNVAVGALAGISKVIKGESSALGVVNRTARGASKSGNFGEFSVVNWKGYPNGPKPEGPFRILEGKEYQVARKAANSANRKLHRADPSLRGKQLHEIAPVKFGGSPTASSNKIVLSPKQHAEYTKFWNRSQRDLNK